MLLQAGQSTLLIVDMQTRLMPALHHAQQLSRAACTLARAARLLEVPVVACEHNCRVLGETIEPLRQHVQAVFQKMHFSAVREPGFTAWLPPARKTVLVVGGEAHICVLQTVLDLCQLGYRAVFVADATGSRKPSDHHAALRRVRAAGADIITTEMAVFEWLETCEHPRFREILPLIK